MAEKKYYWRKLPADFFRNKEIKKLRRVSGGDTFTIIYLKLLLFSMNSDGIVVYDNIEKDIVEQLALELDEALEDISLTLAFLQANRLIEKLSEEEYMLTKSQHMVGSETNAAQRMRKMRKSVTPLLQPVTNSYTEKEREKDIEVEKEKIKSKNKESKPKKKTTSPPKETYAEFVKMTPTEYDKLDAKYGTTQTLRMIEILDNYKGSNKKKYDSDYRAILSWVVDRYEKDNQTKKTAQQTEYDIIREFANE